MKIKGRTFDTPNIEVIILPRGDGNDIVFKAQAVLSYEEFDKLCPKPKAPVKILPGGIRTENVEDNSYKLLLDQWATKKSNWILIQSLRATEGLEWEKVKYDDSNTWHMFEQELIDAKFSDIERQRIILGTWSANGLNESRLEEARQRFLSQQQIQTPESNGQDSKKEEVKNMPSGAPVSA